jgi:hypothetical protein
MSSLSLALGSVNLGFSPKVGAFSYSFYKAGTITKGIPNLEGYARIPSNTNSATVWNAISAEIYSKGGGSINVTGAGVDFSITAPLKIHPRMSIIGDAWFAQKFSLAADIEALFLFDDAYEANQLNFIMRNIIADGHHPTRSTGVGLLVKNVSGGSLFDGVLEQNWFYRFPGNGIELDSGHTWQLIGGASEYNHGNALRLSGTDGTHIYGGKYDVSDGNGISGNVAVNTHIIDAEVSTNGQSGIVLNSCARSKIHNCNIQDNGTAADKTHTGINVTSSNDVQISGNTIKQVTQTNRLNYGIYLGNTTVLGDILDNIVDPASCYTAPIFCPLGGTKLKIRNPHVPAITLISNPWKASTHEVGYGINYTPTVIASTDYSAVSNLYIKTRGGTGVSITIKNGSGSTVASSLTSLDYYPLPTGWTINFGAFSVAPEALCYRKTHDLPFYESGLQICAGSTAVPVASATYTITGNDILISSTGGTDVSITIYDTYGMPKYTGQPALNMLTLPAGFKINFGAFSVAPTVQIDSIP